MSWKVLDTVKMVNSNNEEEMFSIQSDGNVYKIENEFGNISFEFDLTSGYELSEKIQLLITADINEEITSFLNSKDAEEDYKSAQMNLFDGK